MKEREHQFVISVRNVGKSGTDFFFEIPDSWLEHELSGDFTPAGRRGEFTVVASPLGEGYWLDGKLMVHVSTECVRCLRRTSLDLALPFSVHMTPGPAVSLPEEESVDEAGGLGVGHYQGDEIVLDSLVRESIVLALPMNPCCTGGCSIEDLYRDDD